MTELAPAHQPWHALPIGGAGPEAPPPFGVAGLHPADEPVAPSTAHRASSETTQLFRGALLVNAKRDELHAEIYTYFKWLEQSLMLEGSESRANEAGMSITGLQGVLWSLESGFQSVRADADVLGRVAQDFVMAGRAPVLERYRGDDPRRPMEETKELGGFGDRQGGVPQEGTRAGPIAGQSSPVPHTRHPAEATTEVRELFTDDAEEASAPPQQEKGTPSDATANKKSNYTPAPDDLAKRKPRSMPFDFDTGFDLLVAHKAEHGDCEPPPRTRLGRWVHGMRQGWAELTSGNGDGGDNYMVSVQIAPGPLGVGVRLEEKGGVRRAVIVDVCENCTFKRRASLGDCIAMIDGSAVSNLEDLTIGVHRNRIIGIIPKEQLGRPPLPTQDQIRRMESIGFSWEGKARCPAWDSHFEDLLEFYRAHGHFRVPRAYKTEGSFQLGSWVKDQRKLYHAKNRGFMKHKAPKLDAIGFEWRPSKSNFEARFKELVEYKKTNGHVNVPCDKRKKDPITRLGIWVNGLRRTKRRMETKERENGEAQQSYYLTNERIQLLDSVGFEWRKASERSRKKTSSVRGDVDLDDESVEDPQLAEMSAAETYPAEQSAETYPAEQSAEAYPAEQSPATYQTEQSPQYYAWGE